MSFSDYLENKIGDHIFKVASFTVPTNIYVALFLSDPGEAGGGSEVSGNSYARVVCNVWNAFTNGESANTNVINFPTPSPSGWGTVTHFAIYDAITGGNYLGGGALTASKVINAADAVSFQAGAFVVQIN